MKITSLRRYRTTLFIVLLIGLIIGCAEASKETAKDEQHYSSNQQYLFQLLNDYKKSYYAADKTNDKQTIQAVYQDKMRQFLVDSLGRYIDSMTVIVDSVVQSGWLVTTQFHTKEIEFKYGMMFQDSMPPSGDSSYKFMTSFSPGQQVTVGFVHLGGGELNSPYDQRKRTMRIFAYPVPIGKH